VVGQAALLNELATDEATKARAEKIHSAADRCARIVRTFLSMARSRPMERGPVDINGLIDAALELLGYGLRTADITIVRDLAEDLPPVWGESDQLHQVLTNLIINAQQALQEVPPPRELRLSTRLEDGVARIEVADNGPGVDPDLAKRVFEPFVTTKPAGIGTGIGLSVCHGIASAHGGSIELTSSPGAGACFVIRLPLQRDEPAPVAPGVGARARGGRVLMVDDEPEVGELYAEILRREGIDVTPVSSGREALERLQHEPFDLVVSDLRMPDVDGPELYRALAKRPGGHASRMIFITGDALSHQIEQFLEETGTEVLEKPVSAKELVARVRARLAAG
jgi:CheY-like chemotaxis protein